MELLEVIDEFKELHVKNNLLKLPICEQDLRIWRYGSHLREANCWRGFVKDICATQIMHMDCLSIQML